MATKEQTLITPLHITLSADGKPRVADTGIKVIFLARYKQQGLTAEAIQDLHPQLSLAQIYAAFSYYYDNQQALDEQMANQDRIEEQMRKEATGQVTQRELEERWDRLHSEGKLPPRNDSTA